MTIKKLNFFNRIKLKLRKQKKKTKKKRKLKIKELDVLKKCCNKRDLDLNLVNVCFHYNIKLNRFGLTFHF